MYEDGRGVTQNYQEARRLCALASAQGNVNAAKYMKELEEKIHAECPLLGNQVVVTRTSRKDLNGKTGAWPPSTTRGVAMWWCWTSRRDRIP